MLAVELIPLVFGGGEFVDFGNLPQQTLTLFLQCGLRRAGFVQGLGGLTPLRPSLGQALQAHARIGIEQAAHCVRASQALPRVLTVDVEHHVAQGAQLGGSGWAAIDPRTAFALRVNCAFE